MIPHTYAQWFDVLSPVLQMHPKLTTADVREAALAAAGGQRSGVDFNLCVSIAARMLDHACGYWYEGWDQ